MTGAGEGDFLGRLTLRALTGDCEAGLGAGAALTAGLGACLGGAGDREGRAGLAGAGAVTGSEAGARAGSEALLLSRD